MKKVWSAKYCPRKKWEQISKKKKKKKFGKIPVEVHSLQLHSGWFLQLLKFSFCNFKIFLNLVFVFVRKCRSCIEFQFQLLQKFDWEQKRRESTHHQCYLRIFLFDTFLNFKFLNFLFCFEHWLSCLNYLFWVYLKEWDLLIDKLSTKACSGMFQISVIVQIKFMLMTYFHLNELNSFCHTLILLLKQISLNC